MYLGLTPKEMSRPETFSELLGILPGLQPVCTEGMEESQLQDIIMFSLDAYLGIDGYRNYPALILAPSGKNIEDLTRTIQAWRKGAVGVWFLDDLPEKIPEKIPKLERYIEQQYILKQLGWLANLQQQLQPKEKFLSTNFAVKAELRPASQMCGDWIEYWQVDEHTLMFFLADVAGHGLISSFLTPWLAASRNRFDSLEFMLRELNRELCKLDVTQHVAMLAGKIDARSRTLQWCNAGHYPPGILSLPDGSFSLLDGDSLPLGLNPDMVPRLNQLVLPENTHVIFASDGVIELYDGGVEARVSSFINDFRLSRFQPPVDLNDDIGILEVSIRNTMQPQTHLDTKNNAL